MTIWHIPLLGVVIAWHSNSVLFLYSKLDGLAAFLWFSRVLIYFSVCQSVCATVTLTAVVSMCAWVEEGINSLAWLKPIVSKWCVSNTGGLAPQTVRSVQSVERTPPPAAMSSERAERHKLCCYVSSTTASVHARTAPQFALSPRCFMPFCVR